MKIIIKIIDFILPRFCTPCDVQLKITDHFICEKCFSQIRLISKEDISYEYNRKFSSSDFIDGYTSLFVFEESGKLQDLIHALKYKQKFKIGIFLGTLLGNRKKDYINQWKVDLIIPIPLFNLKKIERGYNQADYIAKGLSKSLGIKTSSSVALRIKNTITQTKLDKTERANNMKDAFKIKKQNQVRGKNIIIVDDVITTGITVLELAKKLKDNGANKIYALSVATPLISHTIGS